MSERVASLTADEQWTAFPQPVPEEIEEDLRRKAGFAHLLQEVAVAANEAETLEEALQFALDCVCAFTGWPVGHVYLRDDTSAAMAPADLWHCDDPGRHAGLRAVTRAMCFDPGVGLPGRVAATGAPAWIQNIDEDEDFHRGKQGEALAIKAAFAFPVLAGTDVVAVLEFFAETPSAPDEPLLEVMAHVGTQLGRVAERQRATALLRDREQKLRAAQHLARLGYWEWNVRTDGLIWSDELYRLYGLEPGEAISYERFLSLIHPDDRARVAEIVEQALQAGTSFRHVHRCLDADGDVRYIQGDGEVQLADDGSVLRMFGTGMDVTDARHAEEDLRDSEARYRLLAENATDMIARATPDGIITYVSPACYTLLGYEQDDLVGQNGYAFLHPDDLAQIRAVHDAVLEVPDVHATAYRFRKKDGGYSWVETTARAIRDTGTNAVLEIISVTRDITARRKAEDAIREREERLRALTETALEAIITADGAGCIVGWNRGAERIFGYTKDEILGQSLTMLMPARYQAAHQAGMERVHTTGERRYVGQTVEMAGVRKDGEEFPLELSLSHWETDGETFFAGIIRDVTERKKAEAAIQQSDRRHRLLLTAVKDAILIVDAETHRILEFNDAALRLYGYSPKELLGLKAADLSAEPEVSREAIERISSAHPDLVHHHQRNHKKKDGTVFPVEISAGHVELQGRKLVCATFRDISERRRAEAALRRSREQLRNLAARLQAVREEERTRLSREVHDVLGQALTGLRMDVSLLEDELGERAPSVQHQLDAMKQAIDETVQVTRRIASDLRPGVLDALGIVAALEWEAEKFESRSGVACCFTDCTVDLHIDAERSTTIFRVYQEIMTNVARHAGASRVEVLVENRDGCFVLTVADDGCGIREADLCNTTSLGLLGMRERVLPWGGQVEFEGVPDQGTTVTLTLPLHDHPSTA